MIRLDVAFTPGARSDDVAIVVDVLRMTTTAASLFARGLAELTVIADESGARARAEATGALLRGERGGKALPGFDGGNSPLEHGDVDLTRLPIIKCWPLDGDPQAVGCDISPEQAGADFDDVALG